MQLPRQGRDIPVRSLNEQRGASRDYLLTYLLLHVHVQGYAAYVKTLKEALPKGVSAEADVAPPSHASRGTDAVSMDPRKWSKVAQLKYVWSGAWCYMDRL